LDPLLVWIVGLQRVNRVSVKVRVRLMVRVLLALTFDL